MRVYLGGGGGGEEKQIITTTEGFLFYTFNSYNQSKGLGHWLSTPGEVYVFKIA